MKRASFKPMPVGYPAYHAISQLNRSFEECIENLAHVMSFNLFPQDNLRAYEVMVEGVRALANQDFAEIISDREFHNSAYYERLRLKWQDELKGNEKATDVRSASKHRKAVR